MGDAFLYDTCVVAAMMLIVSGVAPLRGWTGGMPLPLPPLTSPPPAPRLPPPFCSGARFARAKISSFPLPPFLPPLSLLPPPLLPPPAPSSPSSLFSPFRPLFSPSLLPCPPPPLSCGFPCRFSRRMISHLYSAIMILGSRNINIVKFIFLTSMRVPKNAPTRYA